MTQTKLARHFAIIGLCISVFLFIVEQLLRLNSHLYAAGILSLNKISSWLWPGSIMLMAANKWDLAGVLVLLLAVVTNVALYWIVGLLVGIFLKVVSGRAGKENERPST